jgi:hypothetical protein
LREPELRGVAKMEIIILVVGFVIISFIVSLDVIGLTIAKSNYYSSNDTELTSWACLNGLWHAILLATYAIAISGAITFFQINLEFIANFFSRFDDEWLLRRIPDVYLFIEQHFSVVSGIVALVIIWQTYHDKIVSEPAHASRNNLGFLAKLIFDVFELIIRGLFRQRLEPIRIRQLLRSNIEAALVAVDMLALAILANRLQMIETFSSIALFSVIVFVIVTILCYLSGRWAMRYFSSSEGRHRVVVTQTKSGISEISVEDSEFLMKKWWLVTLRLLEPWLIFYFALELISVLLYGQQTHSPGYIFGTTLMLYSIVRSVGLSKVIRAAVADHNEAQIPSGVREAERSVITIFLGIIVTILLAVLGIFIFALSVGFACAIMFEWYDFVFDEQKPALDAIILFGGFTISILSIVVQFVNDDVKYRIALFLDWMEDNYYAFVFSVSAIVIAIIVPIFEDIGSSTSISNSVNNNVTVNYSIPIVFNYPVHAIQVVTTLIWLLFLSYIIPMMRPKRLSGVNSGEPINCSWKDIVMVHDKGHTIFFPLSFISFTMFMMIFVNQSIFDSYCNGAIEPSQKLSVCAG